MNPRKVGVLDVATLAVAIYMSLPPDEQTRLIAATFLNVSKIASWGAEKLGRLGMAAEREYHEVISS